MRPWRKIYQGISTSDKVSRVSDGAFALFTLLVTLQDDAGHYPWTPAKVRALTATRQWTPEDVDRFLGELIAADLVTLSSVNSPGIHRAFTRYSPGMVEIVGGAAKNGKPTQGKAASLPPLFYDDVDTTTKDSDSSMFHKGEFTVNSPGIPREEKRREEESIPPMVPPSGGTTATTAKNDFSSETQPEPKEADVSKQEPEKAAKTSARAARTAPAWEPPEWFRPFLGLPGYKRSQHERAAQQIVAACRDAGVRPGEVVETFAEYYRTAYITNGWTDPVQACKGKPLAIAIKQVAQQQAARLGPAAIRSGAAQLLPVNGHGPPDRIDLDPDDPDWAAKQSEIERHRQAAARAAASRQNGRG